MGKGRSLIFCTDRGGQLLGLDIGCADSCVGLRGFGLNDCYICCEYRLLVCCLVVVFCWWFVVCSLIVLCLLSVGCIVLSFIVWVFVSYLSSVLCLFIAFLSLALCLLIGTFFA